MEDTHELLISWIVPAYNVESFVIQCLQSLVYVGLQDDECEIIVIDDGSSDNTLNVIKDFACKYPHIKVLTQENKGLSSTRNRAIELAKGDYIHFVDSDDFVINGEQLIQCIKFAIENNLDILTFGFNTVSVDSNPFDVKFKYDKIVKMVFSDVLNGSALWWNYSMVYSVWRYIIKRQFIIDNKLRFVNDLLLEDFQFNLNTFFLAKRCARTEAIIYSYRNNPNSIMHTTSKEVQLKLIKSYIANAKYSFSFLDNGRFVFSKEEKQMIKERGNEMLLYGLIRAFKIDKVRFYINELRNNGMYPFEWMTRPEYQMKKVKLFYHISLHENLTVFLSKLFKLYGKINPKILKYNY